MGPAVLSVESPSYLCGPIFGVTGTEESQDGLAIKNVGERRGDTRAIKHVIQSLSRAKEGVIG